VYSYTGLFINQFSYAYLFTYPFTIKSDSYYQKSTVAQGINLTVGVSNQFLKWDDNLTISIFVVDLMNNPVSSANIHLELNTISYIYIYYNISIEFEIINENITVIDGKKDIHVTIQHVPTQQLYTLTAIFFNDTQFGPNVTYPIQISSVRVGIITFEMFLIGYIGLIAFFGILFILFKKEIINAQQILRINFRENLFS